ncbi:hypothetical protein BCR34DRAFT_489197 [Clohesyomyces aquaticus]|uniref:Tocopherol cyclase-domain-containing protein n=1 Tax=Clohesyomyces aquaticus TaxID=1231657 RepID=A0A1Y1ZBU9_9PLEO|nr:hypothetical protein BCR34DRAFT_489197 [Clohesyomyces aquaticus]
MEHFAPHSSVFEGWYSKFDLPSGGHVALVICSVPNATSLPPHMVSFTYYPKSGSPIFQREHWVSSIDHRITGPDNAFELLVPDMGSMNVAADSTTTYDLSCSDWTLQARTRDRTPWGNKKSTPEGWLVQLPLPLHWHVHTLDSSCDFKLDIPSLDLPASDQRCVASVHQEKNWASSFPSSHMWIQARNGDRGIYIAGGKILGVTAYILGYRSPDLDFDFLPPFAMCVLGISPSMKVDHDWDSRAFHISVQGLWRKIVVKASAPGDRGWFGLGSPFPEGHRRNFCTESFLATVEVEVSDRGWWGWKERRREVFEHASLEFGGEYFPERGDKGD